MQEEVFKTFAEAKEKAEKYKNAYARPNPDKKQGGYVVEFESSNFPRHPTLLGCPRHR